MARKLARDFLCQLNRAPDLPDVLRPVAAQGDAAHHHAALLVVIVLHGLLGHLRAQNTEVTSHDIHETFFARFGITNKESLSISMA